MICFEVILVVTLSLLLESRTINIVSLFRDHLLDVADPNTIE